MLRGHRGGGRHEFSLGVARTVRRVRNAGTASVYVGGSAVTTASGFPVSSSDGIVNIPSTGAAGEALYGIAATAGPFSVSYIYAG
jgi:hypothetical protein